MVLIQQRVVARRLQIMAPTGEGLLGRFCFARLYLFYLKEFQFAVDVIPFVGRSSSVF